jgi:hypothetical protein
MKKIIAIIRKKILNGLDNAVFLILLLILSGLGLWWLITWLLAKGVLYVVFAIWGISLPFWAVFVGIVIVSVILNPLKIQLNKQVNGGVQARRGH